MASREALLHCVYFLRTLSPTIPQPTPCSPQHTTAHPCLPNRLSGQKWEGLSRSSWAVIQPESPVQILGYPSLQLLGAGWGELQKGREGSVWASDCDLTRFQSWTSWTCMCQPSILQLHNYLSSFLCLLYTTRISVDC